MRELKQQTNIQEVNYYSDLLSKSTSTMICDMKKIESLPTRAASHPEGCLNIISLTLLIPKIGNRIAPGCLDC